MFKRLMRVLKSWMGFFISFAEDPEVMLQESIEEMRNTLPRLNQILVTTRATVIRLEEERDALAKKEKSLVASIQAALKEGSAEARKIAESDAMTGQSLLLDSADQILIAAEDGRVVLLRADPTAHKEITSFQALKGKTWNHPLVVSDKLLVRNGSEAACYASPAAP